MNHRGGSSNSNAARELNTFAVDSNSSPDSQLEASLFVINLCASMTPLNVDQKGISGFERYKLYQVSRIEDGRRRYRLRLGFFTSQADAEAVLSSMRERFATAFTTCLCNEDLKHASGYLKRPLQEVREDVDLQRTGRFKISPAMFAAAESIDSTAGNSSVPKKAPMATSSVTVAAPKINEQAAAANLQKVAPQRAAAPIAAASVATQNKVATKNGAASSNEIVEVNWEPEARHAPPPTKPAPAPVTASLSVSPNQAKATKPSATKSAEMNLGEKWEKWANASTTASAKSALTLSETSSPAPVKTIPKVPTTSSASPAPFHVGTGVNIPDVGLSLAEEPRSSAGSTKPSPAASSKAAIKPASNVGAAVTAKAINQSVSNASAALPPARAIKPAVSAMHNLPKTAAPAVMSGWRQQIGDDDGIPTLDTTQTIRALTKSEISDIAGLKWFVVQLALSDQPANLDTMPRLDIFEAYRLYSVAMLEGNGIRHALRLGFFTEQVSAEAVMGYLKTFFGNPTIERISTAEHKRFSEAPRPKAMEPKSQTNVITMEEKPRPITPMTTSNGASTIQQTASSGMHGSSQRAATKTTAPAVKRTTSNTTRAVSAKNGAATKRSGVHATQQDLLDEAQLLGLSDTAIMRVHKNPSLLSRLVGKITK